MRVANDGTLQSVGGLDIGVGTGGFANAGTTYAAGNLALHSRSTGGYTADVGGLLESGGALSITGNGTSVLNVADGGTVVGDTLSASLTRIALAGGTRGGTLSSAGNMTVSVGSLTLADGKSAVIGSKDSARLGITTLNVGGALVNNGLLFSGNDLAVNAPSIVNSTDGTSGGIAALRNATVRATTGDLTNRGALYAGHTLTASASAGTLTNVATAAGFQGTIDAGAQVDLQAATLVNHSTIHSEGGISIAATTFRNEVPGGDTRRMGTESARTAGATSYTKESGHTESGRGAGDYEVWRTPTTWSNDQEYASAMPANKPQVIGNGLVDVRFTSGSNLRGTISGGTVTLTGVGTGATFVNDDLALKHFAYTQVSEHQIYWAGLADAAFKYRDDNVTGAVTTVTTSNAVGGAGIFAGTLNGSNFALTNNGATQPVSAAKAGAAVGTAAAAAPTRS
ncbi:MAG: hypothetical protein EOP70_18465, partial [Variovorax sp.]